MIKEYRLSMTVLLLLAVIFFFSTKGSSSENAGNDQPSMSSFLNSSLPDTSQPDNEEVAAPDRNPKIVFDIPSPLKNEPEQILVRKGYIVSYNYKNKLPNWVAWHLTADHLDGGAKRPGNGWHEDYDVPEPRAVSSDYKKCGWTRGHMCPAGDNKWDSEAMYESFLYTNCCPQHNDLNTGPWNQIEIACRKWAKQYGDIYIVCGPVLFRQRHQLIGMNEVVVPEAFFKVVLCLHDSQPKGIGFICRNNAGKQKKDLFVNSISQVERVTGMTFFPHLSEKTAAIVKNQANLKDWEP